MCGPHGNVNGNSHFSAQNGGFTFRTDCNLLTIKVLLRFLAKSECGFTFEPVFQEAAGERLSTARNVLVFY
jgi:hypothetical protein